MKFGRRQKLGDLREEHRSNLLPQLLALSFQVLVVIPSFLKALREIDQSRSRISHAHFSASQSGSVKTNSVSVSKGEAPLPPILQYSSNHLDPQFSHHF